MNNEKYYFGIKKFSANDKTYTVSKWISNVEECAEIYGWCPVQQLFIAKGSLTRTAALWLRCEDVIYSTWGELKIAITKEFSEELDLEFIHDLMSKRRKMDSETILDYIFTMREWGKLVEMPDYVAIKYIVNGISDADISKNLLRTCTTYSELTEKLRIHEDMKQITSSKYQNHPKHPAAIKIPDDQRSLPKQTEFSEGDVTSKKRETKNSDVTKKCAEEVSAEEKSAKEECATDDTVDDTKKSVIGRSIKMVVGNRQHGNDCFKLVTVCFDETSNDTQQINKLSGNEIKVVNFTGKSGEVGKFNDGTQNITRTYETYDESENTRMMKKNGMMTNPQVYEQSTRVTINEDEIFDPRKKKKEKRFLNEGIYNYKTRKKTNDSYGWLDDEVRFK